MSNWLELFHPEVPPSGINSHRQARQRRRWQMRVGSDPVSYAIAEQSELSDAVS
jgi:hypothetical protein